MDDFWKSLSLVVIGFLLGLIGEAIKALFSRERKRLRYTVERIPILAVSQDVPSSIQEQLPQKLETITRFHVTVENTGTQQIENFGLVLQPDARAEVLQFSTRTEPPVGVLRDGGKTLKEGLTFDSVTLDREQRITIDLYVRSPQAVELKVYPFHAGGVDVKGGTASALSLEGHVEGIIKNYIALIVLQNVLPALGYLAAAATGAISIANLNERVTLAGMGVGSIAMSLLRIYFYLRIARHFMGLVRYLADRFSLRASAAHLASTPGTPGRPAERS